MSINFIDPYVCSAQSMCGRQAAVTESDSKMGELISMWTWLHKLIGLSSPVCAGFDTSWCKNEFVFLSYLSKIMVVTHDLYGCEAETSCLMLCSRLHSWTELVFVQTDWDLACIPSWLCSLGEYSRRGNIPHIFACCRHYFKHNKNQKTTFSVSSLFVCRLAVWTCRGRSQSACKTLLLLLFQSTAGCKWWSFFWHVSSGNKWMSTFHHRGV